MTDYSSGSLSELRDAVHRSAPEDDWVWLHAPKNLAQALVVSAAKLLEPFQWLAAADSTIRCLEVRTRVAGEMADVLLYLVLLAEKLDVDLSRVAWEKLTASPEKYAANEQFSQR